jgi:hypothetical protein
MNDELDLHRCAHCGESAAACGMRENGECCNGCHHLAQALLPSPAASPEEMLADMEDAGRGAEVERYMRESFEGAPSNDSLDWRLAQRDAEHVLSILYSRTGDVGETDDPSGWNMGRHERVVRELSLLIDKAVRTAAGCDDSTSSAGNHITRDFNDRKLTDAGRFAVKAQEYAAMSERCDPVNQPLEMQSFANLAVTFSNLALVCAQNGGRLS